MRKTKSDFYVKVWIGTYNHQNFIRQAVDGVLMQKTDFPVKLLISEDYSQDMTREICKEYKSNFPDMIELILSPQNTNGMIRIKAYNRLFNSGAKYIAICDGDDYWTDPYKLQKQVDFFETNPDYGLVHTDCVIVDKNGNPLPDDILDNKRKAIRDGKVFYPLLEKNNFISTLTVCCRADIMKELSDRILSKNLWHVQDYWFWLHISMQSKIKYLPDKTAAYRDHPGGISKNHKKFFVKRYVYFISEVIESSLKNENIKPKTKYQKHVIARKLIFYFRHENIMIKEKFHIIKLLIKYPLIIGFIISLILTKLSGGKKDNS